MEAACRGAKEAGGVTVSIIPGEQFEDANSFSDIVIPSGIGFARNMTNVLSGHAVVVVGGGSGTLSELAYAWHFGKPILALAWVEGVSATFAGKMLDKRRKHAIIAVKDLQQLEHELSKLL